MGMSLEAWLPAEPPGHAGFGGWARVRGAMEASPLRGFHLGLSACWAGGLPGGWQLFPGPCRSPCFSLAYSVLLRVAGPLESRASEESRSDCGWREGGPGWDLGLCLPTSPSDSEAVSDCVFSLSSPVPVSPFPLCCNLALLPCPLPVFWPCSGPSTLGGARPCARGTCLDQGPPSCLWLLLPSSYLLSTVLVHLLRPSCFSGTPRLPLRLSQPF